MRASAAIDLTQTGSPEVKVRITAALLAVALLSATSAAAQGLSITGGVDIFATTTGPEGWLTDEAADPTPRPVTQQRFVVFRGDLHRDVFDPARTQPFEFRMEFMDGVEHRVVIDSIEEVTRGTVEMRVVTGQVKRDELSRINLVLTDNQIHGTVHTLDHVIELRPVGDTISVIQRLDPSRYPKEQEPKPAHRQPGFVKKDPPEFAMLVTAGGGFSGPEPFENEAYEDTAYEPPEIGVLVVLSDEHSLCEGADLAAESQTYQQALDLAFAGYATSRVNMECVPLAETWESMKRSLGCRCNGHYDRGATRGACC